MAQDVLSSLRRNAFRGRTGLRGWLFDHFEELKPAMSGKRPPWSALALTAAQAGHKKDGQPYSRQTIREAWKALEVQMARSGPTQQRAAVRPSVGAPVAPPAAKPATDPSAPDPLADIRAGMAGSGRKLPDPMPARGKPTEPK
jgi:hypothetical protein